MSLAENRSEMYDMATHQVVCETCDDKVTESTPGPGCGCVVALGKLFIKCLCCQTVEVGTG